jgi:hypothetical protein
MLFAVGYTGWSRLETLQEKVKEGHVDGILVIDAGLFAATDLLANGPWSLWGLISSLTKLACKAHIAIPNPLSYATQ